MQKNGSIFHVRANQPLEPGVDVMITFFCDFREFSPKNWRFSQKPML
jgi:hypothetical protein